MTVQQDTPRALPEILIKSQGALNGDVLTVAAIMVWKETQEPITRLAVNPRIYSGNHLPVGDLKVFNAFYDESEGIYWFDIKVRPVTKAMTFVLQTDATIDGQVVPVKFDVSVAGPSPLVVSPVTFDGDVMRFEVSAENGRLMRYPLETLVTREIVGKATPALTKNKAIPYAFRASIDNDIMGEGEIKTYAVMGTAKVDDVVHAWVARVSVRSNDGMAEAKLVGENLLRVTAVLERPHPNLGVGLPVTYEFESGIKGLTNEIRDLVVEDNTVEFHLPISTVKQLDEIRLRFHLVEKDNANAPIFLHARCTVHAWNNEQSELQVEVASHTLKRNVEQLFLNVRWKDGTPLKHPVVKVTDSSVAVQVSEGRIMLSRKVSPNVHRKTELVLAGSIDLSGYGITEVVPFMDTLSVGSDEFPARLIAGAGAVGQNGTNVFVSVRQNNGDIFKEARVETFNGAAVEDAHYDAEQGILSFLVPNSAVDVVNEQAQVNINFVLGNATSEPFVFKGKLRIETPYTVEASKPTWRYRRDVTGRTLAEIQWEITDSEGGHPQWVNLSQLRLNGFDTSPVEVKYQAVTGVLTISVDLSTQVHNSVLFVAPIVQVAGTGGFLTLPPLDTRFKTPGQVTHTGHEFIEDGRKVKVFFDVQGWTSHPPTEVRLANNNWSRVEGVRYDKSYSEYDADTGKLMVLFDVIPGATHFVASTSMQFNPQDNTVYPLEFYFVK